MISWGVTITDHDSHSTQFSIRSNDVQKWKNGIKEWNGVSIRPVIINDKAWIGFNAILLKGVVIGEGAVVAAGSVVTKDVEPWTMVAGNPARVIKRLTIDE
jgi:galactoside O-acetyltransferase